MSPRLQAEWGARVSLDLFFGGAGAGLLGSYLLIAARDGYRGLSVTVIATGEPVLENLPCSRAQWATPRASPSPAAGAWAGGLRSTRRMILKSTNSETPTMVPPIRPVDMIALSAGDSVARNAGGRKYAPMPTIKLEPAMVIFRLESSMVPNTRMPCMISMPQVRI